MIISIAGTPGSGKTSVAKRIAEQFGMSFYSTGSMRGKMAEERGMTIDELNALGEKESFTDTEVDDYQKQLGEKEDNFVIEGRLGWHFIPHSFKILLTCDLNEAARRVYGARINSPEDRGDESMYKDVEDTKKYIATRMDSDMRRYQKYYGINYLDPANYDLVVDTTNIVGAENVTKGILEEMEKRGLNPSKS